MTDARPFDTDARMKPAHKRVFALFERAAAHDAPCPTNADICTALGVHSEGLASRYVSDLEAMNIIRVQRFHAQRVVTIVRTGQSTRATKLKRSVGYAQAMRETRERPDAEPVIPADVKRVWRVVCWRCGVNSDVGCAHTAHMRVAA